MRGIVGGLAALECGSGSGWKAVSDGVSPVRLVVADADPDSKQYLSVQY